MHSRHAAPGELVWTRRLMRRLMRRLKTHHHLKHIDPKGNHPWVSIGSTEAEAEALILWPLMQRADSLEKTLMLGKCEGRRRG